MGEHLIDNTSYNHMFHNDSLHADNHTGHGSHGVHVISWNFEYVAQPLIVVLFILVAMFLKLVFHYASFLSSIIPESCLLIITGTIFGAILKACNIADKFPLDPRTFMLFLLPPIVLDSAYSLHDRVFLENITSILVYAVIGTVLNFMLLGPTLYGIAKGGAMGSLSIGLSDCLLFSSFIVAVDPVAVLAVFQEVKVNNVLYFLVFGESLLNDAVTVVLSSMMKVFVDMDVVPPHQVAIGIASFFTISLGGLAIGILFGVFTSLVTKATSHVRLVEPLAIIILAYASYLVAEMVHWSGIIAMIGCGLVQANYAFHNISRKSHITVNYFVKMLSSSCDCIIFLFLGIELVSTVHLWHPAFILWTLFYCLVFRFIVTFALSFIMNKVNAHQKIDYEEQFIMWYGGLRGAVCFALCDTIRDGYEHKRMFLTTTMIVILFTVFIQGSTIKPLVKLCRIRRKDDSDTVSMFEELNCRVTDHLMTGIEVINHHKGANYVRNTLTWLNDNYFQKWLQKDPLTEDEKLVEEYANILLNDYEDNINKAYLKCREEPTSKFYRTTSPEVSPVPSPKVPPKIVTHDPQNNRYDEESGRAVLRRRAMTHQPSTDRRSISDVIFRRNTINLDDPSVHDMKQLLRDSGLSESSRHQKYDKNLLSDDHRDLEFYLQEKRLRLDRMRRMGIQSVIGSDTASYQATQTSPKSPRNNIETTEETSPLIAKKTVPLHGKKFFKKGDERPNRHEMLHRQDAQTAEEPVNNNELPESDSKV